MIGSLSCVADKICESYILLHCFSKAPYLNVRNEVYLSCSHLQKELSFIFLVNKIKYEAIFECISLIFIGSDHV